MSPRASFARLSSTLFAVALASALFHASTAAAQAPVAGGCTKDIECKGDRICVAGICVDPRSSTPAPAPVPVPAPVPEAPPPAAPPPAPIPAPAPPETRTVIPAPSPPSSAESRHPEAPPPQMVVLYTPPVDDAVSETGLTFGLGFGVAFPAGAAVAPVPMNAMGAASTGALGDAVNFLLPVTLEIGYRLNPHWYLGVYGAFAYGVAANCGSNGSDGASCYLTDFRFGVDVQYRILPSAAFQPWVGAGVGWEILNQIESDSEGDENSYSLNGIELFHADVGLDWRLSDRMKLGPYFQMAVAEYDNGFIHEWFSVGARYQYDSNWAKR